MPDLPDDDLTEPGRWTRLTEALAAATTPLREDFEWLIGEYERLRMIMSRGQRAEAELRTIKRTDDDLAELRRLHEAATPGPWVAGRTGIWTDDFDLAGHDDDDEMWGDQTVIHGDPDDVIRHREDADLIVAMRNALPGLLAEVERLRAASPASKDDEPATGSFVPVLPGYYEEVARRLAAAGSPSPTPPAPTREQIHDAIADALSEHVWAHGTGEIDGDGIAEAADAVLALLSAQPAPPLWTGVTMEPGDDTYSTLTLYALPVPPGTAVEVREKQP